MQTALQALASWSVPIPEEIFYILFIFDFVQLCLIGVAVIFIIAYVCSFNFIRCSNGIKEID